MLKETWMEPAPVAHGGVVAELSLRRNSGETETVGNCLLRLREKALATNSVTRTLQEWCAEHHMGSTVSAHPVLEGGAEPAPFPALEALMTGAGETLSHRKVSLRGGGLELVAADNWFVPERLPQAVLTLLRETDTPFGAALAGCGINRRTTSVRFPQDIRRVMPETAPSDDFVMVIEAVVRLEDRPVAYVRESFRTALLA